MLEFYGEEVTHHIAPTDGNDMTELASIFRGGLPDFVRLVTVPQPLVGVRATTYNDIGVDALVGDWYDAALEATDMFINSSVDAKVAFPNRQALMDWLLIEQSAAIHQARRRIALDRAYGYDSQDDWMKKHLGYTKMRSLQNTPKGAPAFQTLGWAEGAYDALAEAFPHREIAVTKRDDSTIEHWHLCRGKAAMVKREQDCDELAVL